LARSKSDLTDDEGTFLSLLIRMQPATAYQISKVYENSPVSNFGTSKGKIYPLIRSLNNRGLLLGRPAPGHSRNIQVWVCSRRGVEAVRRWVKNIKPTHLLPEDPLRTMVQSFGLLSKDEQIAWIATARDALRNKLDELAAYAREVTVPYKDLVHDNAVSTVICRLAWLDRIHSEILLGLTDEPPITKAPRKRA